MPENKHPTPSPRNLASFGPNLALGICLFIFILVSSRLLGNKAGFLQAFVLVTLFFAVMSWRLKRANRACAVPPNVPAEEKILTNISHEFRTPLVSTQSYIEMLLAQKLGPLNLSQTKALEICGKNIRSLTTLIDLILTITMFRENKDTLKIESVHIPRFLQSLVEEFAQELNERQLRLITHIHLPFPLIEADPSKLRRAFQELINNAVRFNIPSGEIVLTADDANGSFEISITNTTNPLTSNVLTDFFKPFYQAQQNEAGKTKGLGLGLVLAKEIIKLHAGEIRAVGDGESRVTFHIRLPKNLSVKRQGFDAANTSPA